MHRVGDLLLKITSKLEVLFKSIFLYKRPDLNVYIFVSIFSFTVAILKNIVSFWKNWSSPLSGTRHLNRSIATLRRAKFATSLSTRSCYDLYSVFCTINLLSNVSWDIQCAQVQRLIVPVCRCRPFEAL